MASAPAARRHEPHSVPYNLGLLVLVAALLGLGLAYWIDGAARSGRAATQLAAADNPLPRTLGGRQLQIPSAWFRDAAGKATGISKQIDLRLMAPLGASGELVPVLVTLMPRSQVRPSSSLLDGVYLHQFQSEELAGTPGLVGKPLIAADGYEGETVWYDPLSANPFVAKCLAPVSEDASARCLRTVYLGPGIAAIYDFDIAVLAHWREFDSELAGPLGLIGAI